MRTQLSESHQGGPQHSWASLVLCLSRGRRWCGHWGLHLPRYMVSTMLLPHSVPASPIWHPVMARPVTGSVRLARLPGEAATTGSIMLLSLCLPGQPGQPVKGRVRLPLGSSGLCLLDGRQGHEPGGRSVALGSRSPAGLMFECGWAGSRCWYSTCGLGLRLLVELLSTRSSTHSSGL